MRQATILFAENYKPFLTTRTEFLEREGYKVLTAADPTEARHILLNQTLDLVVLDARLQDDNDDNDISGLTLAKEIPSHIPVIILTQYPTVDAVREMLRIRPGGAVAANYIAKSEGPKAFLDAVQSALKQKVLIVSRSDEEARDTMEQFVSSQGLRSIIYQNQPQHSQALVEVMDSYADVGYAIILLAPDDIYTFQEGHQGVTFEFGYLVGKLGRYRVAVLYNHREELAYEYDGITFIRIDPHGAWRYTLSQDMQRSGLTSDTS